MKIASLLVILSLLSPSLALAVGGKYSLGFESHLTGDQGQSSISEFVFQSNQNEVLIKVYLLGAVSKPGLYHIPANTDIFSLLALAGGTLQEARLDHIQIKHRPANDASKTSEINLEKAVSDSTTATPPLSLNDVVLIPTKEPTISNNTVVTVGIVATVIGIVLTGILVNQALKK